ncbi:YcnI family protein [Nocardioides sp. R-C-SC26]|uniref:YcnI family copper-binding membrane protein n=1 Tax=Nocardioides sp. R-C-SC26 TaxID=2870414 RepID=UPI001E2DDA8F|nr:YcnI family protein [Nocardioides sp. R-C-SC26]
MKHTLARLGAVTVTAGIVGLAAIAPASAHVTATPTTTAAGAYTVITFSNGHGCDGSPTTSIAISIPEGINTVTPTRNPLYTIEKQQEQLAPPVTDAHGNELTERTATVVYTAKTPLPDGQRDAFELSLQIPEDAEGQTLNFPTIQTCQQGETAWTEIPAEGQDAEELDTPAPSFVVTAADGEGHHGAGADSDDATDGAEDGHGEGGADSDAESADAAADDSGNGLAIAGLVAGVLGLLAGGAALARSGRKA